MSQTSTIPMPSKNEYKSIDKLASLPMVNAFIDALTSAVNANSYTRAGFGTAKDLSSSVYKYAEPYQARFEPILVRADSYANKTIDVACQTFPNATKTKPEDISNFVRGHTRSASDFVTNQRDNVSKVIDERVKTPTYNLAAGVDKGCTVFVDAFEAVVSKTSDGKTAVPETQYQYQRAIALSKNLTDNLGRYSAEQLKAIQEQNKLVASATATASSINQAASSSIASTQKQFTELSEKLVAQLHSIQTSVHDLAKLFRDTASNTVQTSTTEFQNRTAYIQRKLTEAQEGLTPAIKDLQTVLKKDDIPFHQKAGLLAGEIQKNITPVLSQLRDGFYSRTSSPTQEQQPQLNGTH